MVKMWDVWLTKKDIKAILKIINQAKDKNQGCYTYEKNGCFIEYEVDSMNDIIIKHIE